MTDQERLGAAVARARQLAGWTQIEAAKRLGYSQSRIAKLETGRRRLTFIEAVALARAYGATLASFEEALRAAASVLQSAETPRAPRRGRPRASRPA